MILVDVTVLIYATNAESDQHAESRDWLDGKLSGPAPVGLPWASLLAFLRIATNPRAFSQPPLYGDCVATGVELALVRNCMDARAD